MAMSDYGVNFGGRRIVHPGGYKSIDASEMVAATEGSLNIPIVIGKADAGKSGEVIYFTDASSAKEYLRGGDLAIALELMFSPTPEGGGGASRIGVIVANQTTQATTQVGGLELTSVEYGNGGNKVLVRCDDGTIPGTLTYTLSRWDLDQVDVLENVGAVISLSYDGLQPYADVTVAVDATGDATSVTLRTGADEATAAVDLEVDLTNGEFNTIDDLIHYLNGVYGYEAAFVDPSSAGLSIKALDEATTVKVEKTGSYLMALKGDIEHRFPLQSVLADAKVTGTPATFDPVYLTGGSAGTVPNSWAPYFNAVKKQFSDLLVVLTDSETIHAEALSHVGTMEVRNQSQVLFTGGGVRESVTKVKQRAASLNSSRAVVAYPGIFYKGHEGGKVALPAYFTAAMIAGRVAGVPTNEPITFDYFNILGLDTELIAGDPEVDDLITSGVATIEKVQNGGYRLVQGITTYLGSNNTLYREISVRRGADDLAERIRKGLEAKFVGGNGKRATKSSVNTYTIEELEKAIKADEILSYKNIVVTIASTAIRVDYQVAIVEPNNYVLVTSRFIPESVS